MSQAQAQAHSPLTIVLPAPGIVGQMIADRFCLARIRKAGNRYQILEAIDTKTAKEVLVKITRRSLVQERVLCRDIAWLRCNTSDSRVQKLQSVIKTAPDVALVFERHGKTLSDVMKDGTLTPFSKRYVQEICLQVISGLQYLHRTKVVHSTLSPDVIWLTDDFGYQSHYHRGRDGFVEMVRYAFSKSNVTDITSQKTLRTTKLQIGYYGQMSDKCPGAIVVEGVDQYRAPEVLMG
ncbi:serine/threonine protein kinase [Coprinopsis cinerea okayama7|uniref:Serine/threonine protein kinase n=1 Tax=Coprinopsis cinerea (strain Okayama-7 / 130 / ATCC MYA-4618 / FGSC 9003) TaxID=240176 RepID=A8PIK2_COPC7|nr:serine/threonine protein kinase [Coprinopsis cinerea okayama7\|eukprot:XP_001841584.2 serine/threonine protein kinase [Coprinopsis cinerea okayama7\